MEHLLAAQVGSPLVLPQAVAQAPQLFRSLVVLISQPSLALLLQSAKPTSQAQV